MFHVLTCVYCEVEEAGLLGGLLLDGVSAL